jgi:hypothetical protein
MRSREHANRQLDVARIFELSTCSLRITTRDRMSCLRGARADAAVRAVDNEIHCCGSGMRGARIIVNDPSVAWARQVAR